MPRVLFLLKLREDGYGCPYSYSDGLSSGLFNSARFVVEMLERAGIAAKLAQVVDNNSIDREVAHFRPDVVIIEGLWVVPEKFEILKKLHPKVKWVVRIHSEIPFLAMEGVAMDWIAGYLARRVYVAANSIRGFDDISRYAINLPHPERSMHSVLYLPNYYPIRKIQRPKHVCGDVFRVACLGAIRPLKNQLIQALAAVNYAGANDKKLRFYMTVRDCEQGGDQVLKNIRSLFKHTGHDLVEVPWCGYDDFIIWIASRRIDLGMCVSLSESFCIVAADLVSADIPVVVSPEITWCSGLAQAAPTDGTSIRRVMNRVLGDMREPISFMNRRRLHDFSNRAREDWLDQLAIFTA